MPYAWIRRSQRWRVLLASGLALILGITPTMGGEGRFTLDVSAPGTETIAQVRVAHPPAGPMFLGVARVILPPGTGTDAVSNPGPRLIAVEAGTLSVVLDGPATISRGDADQRRSVPNGRVAVEPGERIAMEIGAIRSLRNEHDRTVIFFDVAVAPSADRPAALTHPEGWSFELLTGTVFTTMPDGPATMIFERRTFPRGAVQTFPTEGGLAMGMVESGSIELEARQGPVSTARGAMLAAYSVAGPVESLPVGERRIITAGGVFYMGHGSDSLAHASYGAAVILMVTINPEPAADETA